MKICARLSHQNTPASLHQWLEVELESRGIDPVIYARYILSVLHDDESDPPSSHFTHQGGYLSNLMGNMGSSKTRHKRYSRSEHLAWNDPIFPTNMEERKIAVIECLKGACEQEYGIESLVNELCDRLKKIRESDESEEIIIIDQGKHEPATVNISQKELAKKYYAAFPALEAKSSNVHRNADKKVQSNWDGKKIINVADVSKQESTVASDDSKRLIQRSHQTTTTNSLPPPTSYLNTQENQYTSENLVENARGSTSPSCNEDINCNPENTYAFVEQLSEISTSSDDVDIYKLLFDKFGGKMEAIWGEGSATSSPDNIWSFEAQKQVARSTPILDYENIKKIWSNDDGNFSNSNQAHNDEHGKISDTTDMMKASLQGINDAANANNTTLSNHLGNSLFMEVTQRNNIYFSLESDLQPPLFSLSKSTYDNNAYDDDNFDAGENLLTSPKTHFQPIKQEFSEESLSNEGSAVDADEEVARLVICSSDCPNIKKETENTDRRSKGRPVSTSFDELQTLIGPFASDFVCSSANSDYSSSSMETALKRKFYSSEFDSSNSQAINSYVQHQLPVVESEPEYEDHLSSMLNNVLKDGLDEHEEESFSVDVKSYKENINTSFWDWCDEDKDALLNVDQKRLSWGYYWDTFNNISDRCRENKSNEEPVFQFDSNIALQEDTDVAEDFDHFNQLLNEELEYSPGEYEDYYASDVTNFNYPHDYVGACATPPDLANVQLYIAPHKENKIVPEKKPCSFFMEGNCRRADCKFSHDIGNITCKFWLDGFCFKGDLCPFLHGYISDGRNADINEKQRFTIESEADFPSLSTILSVKEKAAPKSDNSILFIKEKQLKKKRKKGGHVSS